MNQVHFLTTGGTIDKEYFTARGTRSLSIGPSALKSMFQTLPLDSSECRITEVCMVDSLDMTATHREKLKQVIEDSSFETFVITHGTDTMIETAVYLQEQFESQTIVLVGASQPAVFKTSDAEFNVGTAVGVSDVVSSGVRITMHGRVFHPESVTKTEDGTFQIVD